MDVNLKRYIEEKQVLLNNELIRLINNLEVAPTLLRSMVYSIEAGGKRLRPILLIATYEAFGGKEEDALPAACALEMVHTYSLIHDDLPAMDDDDIRRGKPTNHRKFDEATAILAGDALLTYSFEVLSSSATIPDNLKLELINHLARAAGPDGMVGGQQLDMEAENKQITLEELENIHSLKTGKLLEFAVIAGAKLAGADSRQVNSLQTFAYLLGVIFQVQDDILDVNGDPEKIGKPVGSDQLNDKSTYPGQLGIEGAIKKKEEYSNRAKRALAESGIDDSVLVAITDYLASRDY